MKFNSTAIVSLVVVSSLLLACCSARPMRRSEDALKDENDRRLRLQILDMIRRNDFGGIESLAKKVRDDRQKAKMDKCMGMFQSYAICTQTTSFYLWAQMLARDIMNNENNAAAAAAVGAAAPAQ